MRVICLRQRLLRRSRCISAVQGTSATIQSRTLRIMAERPLVHLRLRWSGNICESRQIVATIMSHSARPSRLRRHRRKLNEDLTVHASAGGLFAQLAPITRYEPYVYLFLYYIHSYYLDTHPHQLSQGIRCLDTLQLVPGTFCTWTSEGQVEVLGRAPCCPQFNVLFVLCPQRGT